MLDPMKRLFILITCLLTLSLFGHSFDPKYDLQPQKTNDKINTSFWYGSGGVAAIVPKATIGFRHQYGHGGLDLSLTGAYLPSPCQDHSLGLSVHPLYFPFPKLARQFYLGGSLGVHLNGTTLESSSLWYFPNFSAGVVCGYQYKRGSHFHFIELKCGAPINSNYFVPIPSLSYGISF